MYTEGAKDEVITVAPVGDSDGADSGVGDGSVVTTTTATTTRAATTTTAGAGATTKPVATTKKATTTGTGKQLVTYACLHCALTLLLYSGIRRR